ncbi:1-phosphofructokinase [Demequina sp. TTPB684]|uniref:1-phosphofructokinase n=1 Tax=unclassified Demequina TaxID=2620311 RepID=UPI001CF34B82|nr:MULTISPECIES: 1-phosphofructokinase [unclassified Demequina]MCB2413549.1 1-phosphofructokinase [Demequina sp. TTPB684]UPU87231.1 1-phosphofructokinase [Demequina sp. TMPB413]
MIVTLTPNPSLDRTISVDQLRVGEVHRAGGLHIDAGGKGVNVSRALAANGLHTVAVLPAHGAPAVEFSARLDGDGVPHDFIALEGAVRTNITIVDAQGVTTKINESGRASTAADAMAMLDAVDRHTADAAWVVGCGSLPPGIDGGLYVSLIERARARGVKVAIDTSGTALRKAVAALPDLIKPNHEELEELVGAALPTLADVLEAARSLVADGIAAVVVSLGEHGALAVDANTAVHASAVVVHPQSTVGAGDCLLAGWLAALERGGSLTEALEAGVRWGAAAVALPGSTVPTPGDLSLPTVTVSAELPLDLALSSSLGHLAPTHKG